MLIPLYLKNTTQNSPKHASSSKKIIFLRISILPSHTPSPVNPTSFPSQTLWIRLCVPSLFQPDLRLWLKVRTVLLNTELSFYLLVTTENHITTDYSVCYYGRPIWTMAGHYIFALWFLSFFLSFFPRLISAVADWMSTVLPHMVWP